MIVSNFVGKNRDEVAHDHGNWAATVLIKDLLPANRAKYGHNPLINNGKRFPDPRKGWCVGNRRPAARQKTLMSSKAHETRPSETAADGAAPWLVQPKIGIRFHDRDRFSGEKTAGNPITIMVERGGVP